MRLAIVRWVKERGKLSNGIASLKIPYFLRITYYFFLSNNI